MIPAILAVLVVFVTGETVETGLVGGRSKRQSYYYVCGTYPNQFYSIYPCSYYNAPSTSQCANGGTQIGVGCYYDYQCTPYANGRQVACSNGCCCTVPNAQVTTPAANPLGFCYNGQRSSVRCSRNVDCASGQTCMNGLCCTTTGNEWQSACGGLGALASCSNGACGAFFCATSNYCCECQFGRTSGQSTNLTCCSQGCPSGSSASTSGYCCPFCPTGVTPYGSCYNGQCAAGYTCRGGNICCPN